MGYFNSQDNTLPKWNGEQKSFHGTGIAIRIELLQDLVDSIPKGQLYLDALLNAKGYFYKGQNCMSDILIDADGKAREGYIFDHNSTPPNTEVENENGDIGFRIHYNTCFIDKAYFAIWDGTLVYACDEYGVQVFPTDKTQNYN